jgi:ribosomal protein L31E
MQTRKKLCETTKCRLYVSDLTKTAAKNVKYIIPFLTKNIKIAERIINDTVSSKEHKSEAKKLYKRLTLQLKDTRKMGTIKYIKKRESENLSSCMNMFCNPGCKNTVFEAGTELSKSVQKKWIRNQAWLDYLNKTRKELFGNKENVLVNDFYEKMKLEYVKKYKKQVAISGCF